MKYTRAKESRYVAFRKANPQSANFIAPEATSATFGLEDYVDPAIDWARTHGQGALDAAGNALGGLKQAGAGMLGRVAEQGSNLVDSAQAAAEGVTGAQAAGGAAGVGGTAAAAGALLNKLRRRGATAVQGAQEAVQGATQGIMANPMARKAAIGAGVATGVGALGVGGKMAYDRMQPEEA